MLLGSDFINWNEGKCNFRELEESLQQALSNKNLEPEVARLATYFAQNPGAVSKMADHLRIELVPTLLCKECGKDHVDETVKFELLQDCMFQENFPPLGVRETGEVFYISDREGRISLLPFMKKIRERILTFVIPQVKASIPEEIVRNEINLERLRQNIMCQVKNLARIRRELKEAGIELPKMIPSLAAMMDEGPPSSRMPTEPAPPDSH